jgi:hypothetical protein
LPKQCLEVGALTACFTNQWAGVDFNYLNLSAFFSGTLTFLIAEWSPSPQFERSNSHFAVIWDGAHRLNELPLEG